MAIPTTTTTLESPSTPPLQTPARPDHNDPDMHATMAQQCIACGHVEAAARHLRTALRWQQDHLPALAATTQLFIATGEPVDAVGILEGAVSRSPGDPLLHYLLAEALLADGQWARAWPHFEWRFRLPWAFGGQTIPAERRWRRQDVRAQRVLVRCPDGHGDAIQFSRYVPLLAARGAHVILAVERPLIPLLAQLPGVAAIVDVDGPLPPYDLGVDRMSLPLMFGTTTETVPAAEGYLKANPERAEAWRRRLPEGRKVGLVWAANAAHSDGAYRTIPVDDLAPLLSVPGVTFLNMQVGRNNAEGMLAGLKVNPAACVMDYAESAAVLANLDVLVTVDTAPAHLGGALGVPTWVLLPWIGNWRWQRRETCPWYRSVRVFRQRKPGHWASVVGDVVGVFG